MNELVNLISTIVSYDLKDLTLNITPKDNMQVLDSSVFDRLLQKCYNLSKLHIMSTNELASQPRQVILNFVQQVIRSEVLLKDLRLAKLTCDEEETEQVLNDLCSSDITSLSNLAMDYNPNWFSN